MNDPRGSQWRKWDLHFHTPKSFDHGDKGMSAVQIVKRLLDAKISVVAVTDHHAMDVEFIEEMRAVADNQLTVLPGIELTSNLGGSDGVHFIAIFSEEADLSYLASELLTRLDINRKRADGVTHDRLYVDFPAAADVVHELGGIITVHGHGKSSNFETIKGHIKFKQEQKAVLLRDYVDIIEVGDQEDCQPYNEIVFPSIGFERPLIVGSDDHCRGEYPLDKHCWIKADPTFAGLRMALREPRCRFCLDERPSDVVRVGKNKTKYIDSISFSRRDTMPESETWLTGDVPLNHGLVAVIGNKGSGKSAFSDCVGLLGSCSTFGAFSFLERKRFRHPKTGRAQHVEATISWHGGDPVTRTLDEDIPQDDPERVKYLPQNFVEQVCNDLATPGGGAFEEELKKVVFSKVAPEDQLGKHTLDELVEYQTEELRDEARNLAQELAELGDRRDELDQKLDPAAKTSLEKKIARKREEIKSHEANEPARLQDPSEAPDSDPKAAASAEELKRETAKREKVVADIEVQSLLVKQAQLRASTADKLLAKLDNVVSAINRAIEDLSSEANDLDLVATQLVTYKVERDAVSAIRDEATQKRDVAREAIGDAEADPPTGLVGERLEVDMRIEKLKDKLSRPQRAYQAYLEAKREWDDVLGKLRGTKEEPESLVGLEAELKELEDVPAHILEVTKAQERIAEDIHSLRVKEAEVYTTLYAPVQRFITDHPLASEHLKLEFKVEVVEEGFVANLLAYLNQNKAGSFHGKEDGEQVAKELAAPVDWANWESTSAFLHEVARYLSHDMREGKDQAPVPLKSQVRKGVKPGDIYAWLYELKFLKPRYLLRWDGKDVEQLSPGERGTLLLIFYLLVDDSDAPLVIDQPEANLDNVTVAEKLVSCIRDARDRRQVIIVTHNPNLAVVCDADQIVHAMMDKPAGNKITYTTGALESPDLPPKYGPASMRV